MISQSIDAWFSKILYEASGRRSRKREETLLATLRDEADKLAEENGARIIWESPLIEARRG